MKQAGKFGRLENFRLSQVGLVVQVQERLKSASAKVGFGGLVQFVNCVRCASLVLSGGGGAIVL